MIRKTFFLFFIIFSNKILLANNIAVVNIDDIIDNNTEYKNILKKFNDYKKIFENEFKLQEEDLLKQLNQIENDKIILNDNELSLKIENYNIKVDNYQKKIEKFNIHNQNQIFSIRNFILSEIIILLENYAKQNNISIVFDATNYVLAADSINVTKEIEQGLKDIKLNLSFDKFEN